MGRIENYLSQRRSYIPDEYVCKVELLTADERVIEEITTDILAGSININLQNGSRRSASITLQNRDLVYNLSPTGKIWLDTKFRIQTGIKLAGVTTYFPQGIFMLGNPKEQSSPSSATVTLELYDKFSLLDGTLSGELLNAIIIPINTNIVDAVKSIFISANSTQPLLNYTLKPLIADVSTVVMPYTLRLDEGESYFSVLSKLAEAISWDIYYDSEGFPRFEPPTDYDTEAPIFELVETDILKLSLEKQSDIANVKNSIRVVGGDFSTGVIYDATAQDISVTSATSLAEIGERQLYIQDDVIYSDALALLRANYELSKAVQVFESISLQTIPLDFLDVGDIIMITDARIVVDSSRYLVRQITLPIVKDGASMSSDVWRTRGFTTV